MARFQRLTPSVTPKAMSKDIPSEMSSARPPKTPDPARLKAPASVIRQRDYDRTAKKK
jgi:hypothetical protein